MKVLNANFPHFVGHLYKTQHFVDRLPVFMVGLDKVGDKVIFWDPLNILAPSTSFFDGWTPAVDVYEDKDKYVLKAELPGMKKEEINVALEGNTLSISGERKHEEERKEGESYRSERYFGRFQRSITLPAPVDANKIQASYKDGVLSVTLPKSEEAKPKQIQVKTS